MKKLFFFMIATSLLAVSCKNKNAAKTLEGTWNETKIDGTDVPLAAQDQMTFGKCAGGDNKSCDLTITDAGGTSVTNYDYTVTDKGETLVLKLSGGILGTISQNHDIVSLTETQLVIDWKLGGGDYTGTYTKQ